MSINHHNHFHEEKENISTKNIKVAFFLNVSFTIVEIIGGFMTNSMAIISDAIHDLGDCLTLALSWILTKFSSKTGDNKYTFGYRRFALIGAVINSTVLFLGSIFIIKKAISRIMHPEQVEAKGMFILAILGVLVNGYAAFRFMKSESTITERSVMLHLLEDVLGWIAVLIVSIVMFFVDFPMLDSILSLCISGFILFNVFKNFKTAGRIFLQAVPYEFNIEELSKNIINQFKDKIVDVHDVHLWSLDGIKNILSFHLVLDDDLSFKETTILKSQIKNYISDNYKIDHITIESEATHCNEDNEVFESN